jgi:hypothetical protein
MLYFLLKIYVDLEKKIIRKFCYVCIFKYNYM